MIVFKIPTFSLYWRFKMDRTTEALKNAPTDECTIIFVNFSPKRKVFTSSPKDCILYRITIKHTEDL